MGSTIEEVRISVSMLESEKGQMTTRKCDTFPKPSYRGHRSKEEVRESAKQVMARRHNDTSLHLAAQQGDLLAVKKILDGIDYNMVETLMSGVDIDAEVAEIRASVVNEVSELGDTALFTAAERGHLEVVNELLKYSNKESITKKNRLGVDALHIAAIQEHHAIVQVLSDRLSKTIGPWNATPFTRYDAVRANELNPPRDELRKATTQIKKEFEKLHRQGKNNATNSMAVLFASVTFAAIFTVPGGDKNDGLAMVVSRCAFMIFFICNATAFFTSLAVVVVQNTVIGGETEANRRVVEFINKLMCLASVCTFVSFMASSYILVGRRHEWAAGLVTVIGAVIIAGVLGTVTYYVVESKREKLE